MGTSKTLAARPAGGMAKKTAAVAGQSASAIKADSIELINIGLMILALTIASVVPFELFLLSYAVLGPLHYLTEISWLKDRRFFTMRRFDWLPLVACGILIMLGNGDVLGQRGTSWLNNFPTTGSGFADCFRSIYPDIAFFALAAALIFAVTQQTPARAFGLVIAGGGTILFHAAAGHGSSGLLLRLFSIYLPTLIHVFVFTGAFILAGALKRNRPAGYTSFAMFLICGALAIWLPNLAATSRSAAPQMFWRGFRELSLAGLEDIMRTPIEELIGTNVYTSDLVMRLVRFMAFAYTYHYLNWFSKTSIIQWHAVPASRQAIIGVGWLLSVALYMVNFELGLRWLFLLSLSHVLLEFPLNHKCFLEIAVEFRRRLSLG
jgi:hypothetical protein